MRAARVTEAALVDARAALNQAELNLSRTEVLAPFTGLVRSEQVDPGQFVNRGSAIARLYAVDYVEVRLPIADQQLAYLDIPPMQRGELDESNAPDVLLSADFAGQHYTVARHDRAHRSGDRRAQPNGQRRRTRPDHR